MGMGIFKTKLIGFTISLIVVTVSVLGMQLQTLAATNSTTIGTLELVPAVENISVYSSFSGDDNGNNNAILEYRKVGTTTWNLGITMTPDRRQQYSRYGMDSGVTNYYDNPWKNQWRSIILGLQPNTDYEVRVTYTDPDGGSGSVTRTVKTLSDNPPSNGSTYYISTSGSDSNDGLTPSTAFATIRHAQEIVQAGDRVLLMPGTYSGSGRNYPMTAQGTLNNYITFESADPNNRAVVSGDRLVVSGAYIRFSELDFEPNNALQNIVLMSCHHVIIEDCELNVANGEDWNWGGPPSAIIFNDVNSILIQRNQIFSDDARQQKFGIYSITDNSYAITIRSNTFTGHGMKDATSGQWLSDTFIYDNYVDDTWDDCFEVEGLNVNVAFWSNTTKGGAMGLGMAPVAIGPYYIFRNTFANFTDAGLKMGNSSSGTTYIYHNTIYTLSHVRGIGTFGNNALVNNIIMRNNIIETGYYVIDSSDSDSAWNFWDIDYDNLLGHDSSGFSKWRVGATNAQSSLHEFQQALANHPGAGYSNEVHAISEDPQFVSATNGNFSLKSTSPCIDAGVILTGFNDANSPWPYSGNAPDIGAYEYAGGSATNYPPVLSAIGNKSVNVEQTLQFTISAADPDGDPLTYSASNLPSGATFTPSTRTFSWTPTSSQAGTYSNVRFTVSDGTLTDYEDITITVSAVPVPPSTPLRVNAGGSEYIDSQSNTWLADQAYVSGSWGFYGTDNTADRGTAHSISGTIDDRIYQTERYSLSGYEFDLENGTYDVALHFAETYFTSSDQRVFDVSIEGQLVLDNLDIYSEVGYSTALIKAFNGITVQDGQLDIEFTSSIDQPEINGIEILAAGANSPPVLSPIGNKTVSEGELLQFTVSATDPDSDTLTYSASSLPQGAAFNTQTRIFSWTPTSGQAGTYSNIRFTVSDGSLTDYEYITITVVQLYEDWDVNGDGATNILDFIVVGQHWGETGLAGWIRADVNKDGIINVLDMIIIGQHWTG
jgi:hypothetical protein